MHELAEQIRSYLAATWRYRWYAISVAWLIGIAGWTAVSMIPDRYKASARVYVDTQSILRPLLGGLAMQPNVTQIVEMMSRTLISRPNVEKLMGMADIADGGGKSEHEERVNRLTKELAITGTGAQNFYAISYSDHDPQRAKRVVKSLLTIFEEGLGDKRKDSDSARDFIDDQLKVYSERLTAAENAVTEFKRRNMGLMPGQGQNFFARLAEARTALNQARLELAEAEQGREAIHRRFSSEPPPSLINENAVTDEAVPFDAGLADLDQRIGALQQKLDTLRLTYTDQHPDILALLPAIERLKAQRQREVERKQPEARARKVVSPISGKSQDPVYAQLTMSMAEYDATVASLRIRVQEYQRRLNELKASANAVPQVEAEFTQLTRDYEVTKKNYDQLAARRDTAQLTGDVQSNASVMEFRVIDPPQVPVKPDWPNRPLLFSLVLVVAIAGGIAIAFVVSQLRPTIESEQVLREVSGLAVFGTVVMALNPEEERRKRVSLVSLVSCTFGLFVVYLAMMAMPLAQQFTQLGWLLDR